MLFWYDDLMKLVTNKKIQSLLELLFIAALTIAVFFQRYYVLSSDPLLAWPLTDSMAYPNRYSPNDLLINAGVHGNFLLYRLLSYLPILANNYPLRDFLIFIPIYFFTLLAWFRVFREIGATKLIAITSLFVLVCSDDKLSLNWAHVVPAYFISATSVQFLQVFGFLWFLQKKRSIALILTAATGYFHPASAVMLGTIYSAIILYEAIREKSFKALFPILLFIGILTPNAVLIALNNQGGFFVKKEFFTLFEAYQPQAYLKDHFRYGYAYTFALLLFIFRYHLNSNTWLIHKREILLFIGVGVMGCGIWLVNLYFFQNLQIIQTFYLMRFFSLLHPLIIVFTISTVISYLTLDSSYAERSILFLVALTPMIFSPVFALILVTTSVAFIEKRQWSILLFLALNAGYFGLLLYGSPLEIKRLLPFILNAILYLRVSNSFNGYQVFVFLIFLFLLFEYKFPKSSIRIENSRVVIVSCIGIIFVGIFLLAKPGWQRFKQADYNFNLLFNFNPSDYWGVRESDRNYSELLDWVKESPYKIFTVPPYNDKFLSFRFLTGKGVYIFHRDIAQLMYSPKYYIKAIKRLVEVAGNSPELPKAFMSGEIVRGNGDYEKNCLYLLESSDYDAVIFDRRQLIIEYCGSEKSIFQNSNYVVFKAKGNLLEKEPDANVDVRAP